MTYPELEHWTLTLARSFGLVVKVAPLPDVVAGVDGRTDGRIVWYPRNGAPAATVAHELAHLVSDDDHGPVWHGAFVTICQRWAELRC